MTLSNRVLFISAGMLQPKKRDHALARRQLYLNYGALTLASLLEQSGIPAVLVHGAHELPELFLEKLRADGLLPSRSPVMLSLPSFYALGWAQEFCRRLKDMFPECIIIAGGRWVTSADPDWLLHRVPELDTIVPGLGEEVIHGLVGAANVRDSVNGSQLPDFPLNHHLIDGFTAFQPSIEASRGCGMGCIFCEERAIPLSRLRAPELLADYMEQTLAQYDGGEIHPYLQSSFFLPTPRWAARLHAETEKRGLNMQWRCETRVDAMKPETVQYLAAAGLKVVDLGLETASPQQMVAMNKSVHVDRYLRSASELLAACRANGVWVKANVLLYAGETARTVSETREWLDQHADAIKGVSVGPVMVFGSPKQAAPLIEECERAGGCIVDPNAANSVGISTIHPSAEIDAAAAEAISLDLSRRYMSKDDYFDLKAFSYYSRNYRRSEFEVDVLASDISKLPFEPTSHLNRRFSKPSVADCAAG